MRYYLSDALLNYKCRLTIGDPLSSFFLIGVVQFLAVAHTNISAWSKTYIDRPLCSTLPSCRPEKWLWHDRSDPGMVEVALLLME